MKQGSSLCLRALLWLCALTAFGASWCIAADVAIPPLKARVTDLTATLTAQQQSSLEQTLAAFEARKGSQIAVLLVPTTQPETVEQYAVRVEESWKLGRKGIDDGALLLIAKNDRKLWIEVGYGLEGVLNDATAKRIIDEAITPRFKQGDFYGGISAGIERMIKVVDGEPLPPPKPRASQQPAGGGFDFQSLLIIGFVLVFVVGGVLRAIFGRFLGAGIVGTIAGVHRLDARRRRSDRDHRRHHHVYFLVARRHARRLGQRRIWRIWRRRLQHRRRIWRRWRLQRRGR